MKIKQIILVSVIACISFVCMAFMNYNYDSLSRYPYPGEENRKLIKQYLNSDEIEYIIEYSIAPSVFTAFIKEPGFNIYHAEQYHELSELLWDKTPATIVKYTEETYEYYSPQELATLLIHYNYDEIAYWISFKDEYNPLSTLVSNAGDTTAYVSDDLTISIRIPFNLVLLNEDVPTYNNQTITIDKALQDPLANLCDSISSDETVNSPNACGGLLIESGYISYQEQVDLWKTAKETYNEGAIAYEFMPGHSEHQLGLAVDFTIEGLSDTIFGKTAQYTWLVNNAYKFGFVQTYVDETAEATDKLAQPFHWRYVGEGLAGYLHDNNLTFVDYISNQNQPSNE